MSFFLFTLQISELSEVLGDKGKTSFGLFASLVKKITIKNDVGKMQFITATPAR